MWDANAVYIWDKSVKVPRTEVALAQRPKRTAQLDAKSFAAELAAALSAQLWRVGAEARTSVKEPDGVSD
jgi:hypothetical protein